MFYGDVNNPKSSATLSHEHSNLNVLRLFQQFSNEMKRSTEVQLRLLPILMEDFLESDQILPMIFGEFLGSKKHPLLLSYVLRFHIPKLFEQDLQKEKDIQHFADWINVCMSTFQLKVPISHALWGLLCLFVCMCMCNNKYFETIFVEIGTNFPCLLHNASDRWWENYGEMFEDAFLMCGVCFYRFMQQLKMPEQVKTFIDVLHKLKAEKCELADRLLNLLPIKS